MSFCCLRGPVGIRPGSGSRLIPASQIKASPLQSGLIFLLVAAFLLGISQTARGQISKGNQILLSRGLQLQGMVESADIFHLEVYTNAGYNSVNWFWSSDNAQLGAAPGFPWCRWVSDSSNMPPQNGEAPYLSQLVSLELGDEWNINDDTIRTTLVNWFTSVQTNWPGTILFHNNYGGQASDNALGDFISRAHPDMLCFDTYPFKADYTTGVPNTGPFLTWFSELRRYRQWGISVNLPFATYMQTFHSRQDYDQTIYRNPSPSELRLNTFGALAFNAKTLIGFTYNNGATSLFDILPNGYSGDTYTNALYGEQADANRRAMNLGKALVCLKPIYDLHNPNDANPPPGPASGSVNFPPGLTTSIMILRGRTVSGGVTNYNALPIGFQNDPEETATLKYSWWEFAKNEPYLNGWVVNNKGTTNNGLAGDVIISWFKPLDESFDGPTYSNEVYLMVVNALTITNGSAADCWQEIKLNFQTGSTGPSAVLMLDPLTGLVTTNAMPTISGSGATLKRQLVLNLNGGDAALFKFADGAPFVGCVPPTRARLAVTGQTGTPLLTLQGTQGARYQLQTKPLLGGGSWTTLTNLLLPSTNYLYQDASLSNASGRYYRAVGIP